MGLIIYYLVNYLYQFSNHGIFHYVDRVKKLSDAVIYAFHPAEITNINHGQLFLKLVINNHLTM